MRLNNSQIPQLWEISSEGQPGEKKAIFAANIKVNVSFLKVFVFSLFFLEVPACYIWRYSMSLWQLSAHWLAFSGGHARIVSIPGFFHKLPWVSTASRNGHIFTDWPATINWLCWGSDETLNLYSQHPIPALTDDMNKLLFSHRALTVTRPQVWILQAWLPSLNARVSHARGLLEPDISHARSRPRKWEVWLKHGWMIKNKNKKDQLNTFHTMTKKSF